MPCKESMQPLAPRVLGPQPCLPSFCVQHFKGWRQGATVGGGSHYLFAE